MSTTLQDPKTQYPQPPMPVHPQQPPGSSEAMSLQPDYGEKTYKGSGKLQNRAAIITGADSGIGRAVALAFAREGADVLIAYLNEHGDAEDTARLVREAGRKAVTIAGDIGQEQHCRELVDTAIDKFGKLDILVNNAAFQMTHKSIQEFS